MTNAAKTEQQLKSEAYSAATKLLREKHKPEYNELLASEMRARGIEWAPRPTESEKAEAEVERLLAAHPELRSRFSAPSVPVDSLTD